MSRPLGHLNNITIISDIVNRIFSIIFFIPISLNGNCHVTGCLVTAAIKEHHTADVLLTCCLPAVMQPRARFINRCTRHNSTIRGCWQLRNTCVSASYRLPQVLLSQQKISTQPYLFAEGVFLVRELTNSSLCVHCYLVGRSCRAYTEDNTFRWWLMYPPHVGAVVYPKAFCMY